MIKESLAKLLKVKSIITISTTLVFCFMLICSVFIPSVVIPQEFMMIYTTIIAFYFGTQYEKKQEAAVNETSSSISH